MTHDEHDLLANAKTSTYNGWTNRETWLANLWLVEGNETPDEMTAEALRNRVLDMVQALDDATIVEGFIYDLLIAAIGRINYNEIVETYK
jgi:hypothetical protein